MAYFDPTAYGATGDGVTDDTNAVQAALDAAGSTTLGGAVTLGRLRFRIDAPLTVPKFVQILADNDHAGYGMDGVNQNSDDTLLRGGALLLGAAASIEMKAGSAIKGALIYRQGLVMPTDADGVAAFAGTAIVAGGDDVEIEDCVILGFDTAFFSDGHQRPSLTDVKIDCTNGIEITACRDVAHLTRVHCWPGTTVQGFAGAPLIRAGIGFNLHDICDSAKVDSCFAFGYFRGLVIDNANAISVINSGFDNLYGPGFADTIGVRVAGTSQFTAIIGCQFYAQELACIEIDTAGEEGTKVIGNMFGGGSRHGVLVHGGNAVVDANEFQGIQTGVTLDHVGGKVAIEANIFRELTVAGINVLTDTTTEMLRIGDANVFTNVATAVANGAAIAVATGPAAASTIVVPPNGNIFIIPGSAVIREIQGIWTGREVTLMFTGSATIRNNAKIRLSGSASFHAVHGACLTFKGAGDKVLETSRTL